MDLTDNMTPVFPVILIWGCNWFGDSWDCCLITDFGEESGEKKFIMKYFQDKDEETGMMYHRLLDLGVQNSGLHETGKCGY